MEWLFWKMPALYLYRLFLAPTPLLQQLLRGQMASNPLSPKVLRSLTRKNRAAYASWRENEGGGLIQRRQQKET